MTYISHCQESVPSHFHVLIKEIKDKDGLGNPIISAHLSEQIFANIETGPYCLLGEEAFHIECQSWYQNPYISDPDFHKMRPKQ